tara:strand:+ start:2520 stop:3473 length:954 start_codon:yes stop_codon:yes gene_type:complete
MAISHNPDASQMRRAGKPTVTSEKGALGTMARLADQEARHKSVLRPTGTASYDPKTREMRRLSMVVDQLTKEQLQMTKAENAAADVFSSVSQRVTVLETAFGELVDAVSQELDQARGERKKWNQNAEALEARISKCEEKTLLCEKTVGQLENTFDDHAAARKEARGAALAVVEARNALHKAEHHAAEVTERLAKLQNVAHDADNALQVQIDEIRDAVVSMENSNGHHGASHDHMTPGGTTITTRDILLAGAASEADVVALRDWTKLVTEVHETRLARVEELIGDGGKKKSKSGKSQVTEPTPTSRRKKSDQSSEGSA